MWFRVSSFCRLKDVSCYLCSGYSPSSCCQGARIILGLGFGGFLGGFVYLSCRVLSLRKGSTGPWDPRFPNPPLLPRMPLDALSFPKIP